MAAATANDPLRAAVGARWSSRRVLLPAALVLVGVVVMCAPAEGLSMQARLAFVVFGLAIYGWVATSLNETWVAVAAALTFTLVGAEERDVFFASLGDPTIWLLLGAFVLAAAAQACGLARRLAVVVVVRARSVRGLFAGLTAAITLTAFVIPSTSGRAALLVPVFLALAAAIEDKRIVRALALLFPTVILLSAIASLVGAGAHLVTAQILERTGNESLSYGRWLLLGTPFALVSAFGSSWAIQRLFLNREERHRALSVTAWDLRDADDLDAPSGTGPMTSSERTVLSVMTVLVALWCTESLHGIDASFVAIAGALAVTMPGLGVVGFKDALKQVDFGILVFLAATLVLGHALIDSGGANWLVTRPFSVIADAPTVVIVGAVAALSLLAHLVITSRTARSSVLVPLVILLGASAGVNPTLLAFVSTAAAGFCLTLPVSAKPVLLFSALDHATFAPGDLLRLSRVLLPAHLVVLIVFAFTVWPALGLKAAETPAVRSSAASHAAATPPQGASSAPTSTSAEEAARVARGHVMERARRLEREPERLRAAPSTRPSRPVAAPIPAAVPPTHIAVGR